MFYRSTKLVLAGVLISCGAILGSMVISGSSPAQPKEAFFNSVAYPTNSVGLLNQCGDVFDFNISENLIGVIPADYTQDPRGIPIPPMIVPVYGFMSSEPFDISKGEASEFGQKEIYTHPEIMRGLWEGVKIIWVNDEVTEEAFQFIKEDAAKQETPTIVLTWEGDDDRAIPMARNIAFSSWGVSQSCKTYEQTVFKNFLGYTVDPKFDRDLQNPPMAPLDEEGMLFTWAYDSHGE